MDGMFNFLKNWSAVFKKSGDQSKDFGIQLKWFHFKAV